MNLRRVLILADESADWMVAGLRQLERLALSVDEFAVDNNAASPVTVCIFWKPDREHSERWIPANPRLTKVAFRNDIDREPYDLVLSTRMFLYRKAVTRLLDEAAPVLPTQPASWENEAAKLREQTRAGVCEFVAGREQIDETERKFLRGSGKTQDGFVSRYLNRPISRAITRLLLPCSVTPNAWTWLIFPIPIVATLLLARGTYWSFLWGLILFQVFSILDGCDGEIARAKFLESERGRQLDDFFDVLSNMFLVLGLGFGLNRRHSPLGPIFLAEGIAAAVLIAINEWFLARTPVTESSALGETLYPRHRGLVERSRLLFFGKNFASLVIQFTKRDVAVLFFVVLAAAGLPSLILHLLLLVTAVTLVCALKSR